MDKSTTNYRKYRKEKVSQCNICLKEASLSWDHVPPKGGIKLTALEEEPLMQYLTGNKEKREYNIAQSGVRYRTICSECNAKLGSYYDNTLNQFAQEIGQMLKSKLILPQTIKIKTKPSHLVRAICGHLLAAKMEIGYTDADVSLREFVFDESRKLPDKYKVFYWLYPYSSTLIMRDIGLAKVPEWFGKGVNEFGMINLLKYFPIAYMVTTYDKYEGIRELTSFCYEDSNKEVAIPVDLMPIREHNFPEKNDEHVILMGGPSISSAVYAVPRNKNNK